MNKLLPLLLILLITFVVYPACGQDNIPEFGKVDMADLKLSECPFEKGADAMYLIKTENVTFQSEGFTTNPRTITEYRVRIKIFNESGFKNANIVIPYSGNSHSVKITDVEAVVFTLDETGNMVTQKVEKNEIFKEKSKSAKSHNSVRFTFPNLKKGAVVEYRYKRFDKNSLVLRTWLFQDELPSRFTKCSFNLPSYFKMAYHIVASLPVDKDSSEKIYSNNDFNEYKRSFTMRNVPAFKMEPFISSFKDNLQRVEFAVTPRRVAIFGSVMNRWDIYNNMLLEVDDFGEQFNKPVDSTTAFIDSVTALQDKTEKIKAAYTFVKKNIKWNGEQSFYPVDIAGCWKDKTGSSGEMNILLLNLLRKVGISCYPILVSTRENGKLDQSFPSISQFDGVDVMAFDTSHGYVLDCTQKNLSFKTTPYNILNRDAFIVDKKDSKWINITDDRPLMKISLSIFAKMDSAGVMKGTGDMAYVGLAKAETLEREEKEEKDKDKDNTNDLAADDAADLKIDSVNELHANDDNDTLLHKVIFHSSLSNTGDDYFLNPFMFSMFKKNPFKDTARYADIDFGSNQLYLTKILVIVPDNFEVEDIPKSVFIRMEDSAVMFKREIFSANKQLLIRNSFTVNRTLFDKEEYSSLKSFFDKVYALINEQIVLKKKDEPSASVQ